MKFNVKFPLIAAILTSIDFTEFLIYAFYKRKKKVGTITAMHIHGKIYHVFYLWQLCDYVLLYHIFEISNRANADR